MGAGWRRFTEKVRESTGIGSKNFQKTTNERNRSMIKEAGDFSGHLKNCQRAIKGLKAATEDMLKTTKSALTAPLPHVFEETAAHAGGNARPMTSIGGPGFKPDVLSPLSQSLGAQLESQVMVPLNRWMDIYISLQQRMKDLEALRLEVDSRKHTVQGLVDTAEALRSKISKAGGDPKLDAQLEETQKKLTHKEGKLALASGQFDQQEQQLYEDLSTLIKDAQWLSHYVGCALKLVGETLMNGAGAFDSVKRPSSSSSAVTPRSPAAVQTPSPINQVPAYAANASGGRSSGSPSTGDGHFTPITPENPFAARSY